MQDSHDAGYSHENATFLVLCKAWIVGSVLIKRGAPTVGWGRVS